jgi:8-oxo-dGTP pyrophosphatase MutT (NUDIX family)
MTTNPIDTSDPLGVYLARALGGNVAELPGHRAQARFAPELAYGRHAGPPSRNARLASVLLLVYRVGDEHFIPLTVRHRNLKDHGGQISLPGGMQEGDEVSSATALREVREELGCAIDQLELLGRLTPIYVYNSDFLVTPWVAIAAHRPDFAVDPIEVEECFELPLSVLLDSSPVGRLPIRRGHLEFSAPCIQWRQYAIWGATSMILSEFADLVRGMRLTA